MGEGISPRANTALQEVGVFLQGHRARQADPQMLEDADLVLAMTRDHADTLRRISPLAADKIHTLIAFAAGMAEGGDIPDPYGQPMTAHRASVRQLLRHLDAVMKRMKVDSGTGA